MTGVADLNDQQFSYYRGLHIGANVDPHDDEAVLGKIKGRNPAEFEDPSRLPSYPLYGQHWSTEEETSRQFALKTHLNMGNRGYSREGPRSPVHGVVVEARSATPPKDKTLYKGYGEREVEFPHRDEISEVVAHVHRLEPHHDLPLKERNQRRKETFVRSFTVPPEHWKNA